jgi:hypothetical protein
MSELEAFALDENLHAFGVGQEVKRSLSRIFDWRKFFLLA